MKDVEEKKKHQPSSSSRYTSYQHRRQKQTPAATTYWNFSHLGRHKQVCIGHLHDLAHAHGKHAETDGPGVHSLRNNMLELSRPSDPSHCTARESVSRKNGAPKGNETRHGTILERESYGNSPYIHTISYFIFRQKPPLGKGSQVNRGV